MFWGTQAQGLGYKSAGIQKAGVQKHLTSTFWKDKSWPRLWVSLFCFVSKMQGWYKLIIFMYQSLHLFHAYNFNFLLLLK